MSLKNHLEIINFLKSTSSVYQDVGREIIIHCPYCDDALRPNARSHGHLYISTDSPVFHCFRCETSGYLGILLRDLGFSDPGILEIFGKPRVTKLKEKSLIRKKSSDRDIHEVIKNKNLNFSRGDQNSYNTFEKYIYRRLGSYCDINKYLITPEFINKRLCAGFYNSAGYFVTARILDPINNIRYIRDRGSSEMYFFQNLDFDEYKTIVLTEGVFDSIKLYRFSSRFPKNQTFFLSILGKNYGRAVNWLASQHIPIGNFNVNLVFDNDNKYLKKTLCLCRKIAGRINSKIEVRGFHPTLLNDAGEFPYLEEV